MFPLAEAAPTPPGCRAWEPGLLDKTTYGQSPGAWEHRYKQTQDALLLNMVSKNTCEGRVLKVLLDKRRVDILPDLSIM